MAVNPISAPSCAERITVQASRAAARQNALKAEPAASVNIHKSASYHIKVGRFKPPPERGFLGGKRSRFVSRQALTRERKSWLRVLLR